MPQAQPSRSLLLSLGYLLLVAAGLFLLPGCEPDTDGEPADLTLLYTGNVHGYIEPCGCAAGQIGGIDRIAGYVEDSLRELGDRGLFIDTGDLLANGYQTDGMLVEQLQVKARGFFEIWGALGCEALALGEAEVSLGVREVAALGEEFGVPVICANLVDRDGEQVLPSYRIIERAGLRIGVFSVLASNLTEVDPKKKPRELKRYVLPQLLKKQGLVLQPWQQRAAEVIAELRPQVDVLVCASHLGYDNNVKLAKRHPEVDLVVGGHFGSSTGQTDLVGSTPVLTTRINGSRVGRMEWWLPEPDAYLGAVAGEPRGELLDASARGEAKIQIDVSRQAYSDLSGMERKHGSAQWQRKLATEQDLFDRASEQLQTTPPPPDVNRFSHNQVPMHRGIRRSAQALAAVDQYHLETTSYWQARDAEAPAFQHDGGVFVGAESCAPCHVEQYEFWLGTRHSRAFATLEATSQAYDAECIGCHTVGFGVEGGFDLPTRSEGFRNVQCAACHGAGGAHVSGGRNYLLKGLINNGLNGCARCHKGEHDPTFEQTGAEKLAKVACPPIGPPGTHSSAMNASYLQAAIELYQRNNPNWDLVSRAFNEAGELERALEVAREWVAAQPANLNARLNLAERAINSGEYELALKNYRIVTNNEPDNPRGWMGLAFAEFGQEQFPAALEAARECYSLSPQEGMAARIVGMSLMASGKPEEALDLMQRHLVFHPDQEHYLADLIAQLLP